VTIPICGHVAASYSVAAKPLSEREETWEKAAGKLRVVFTIP